MDYFRLLAQVLQQQGRGGDTVLAHITPAEAALLKKRGGAGTVNPVTGLLEFYDADSGQGGDPSGGDSGGGGGGDSGWGGGDWGGYSEPGVSPDSAIAAGYGPESPAYGSPDMTDPDSAIAAGYGPESPGYGFGVSPPSYNDGGGNDSVYVPAPVAPAAPAPPVAPPVSYAPSEAFMQMLASSQNIGVPRVSIFGGYGGRSFVPSAAVMARPVFNFMPPSMSPALMAPMAPMAVGPAYGGQMAPPTMFQPGDAASARPTLMTMAFGPGLPRRFL